MIKKVGNNSYFLRILVFACALFFTFLNTAVLINPVFAAPLPQDDLHAADYDSVHHKTYCATGGGGEASGGAGTSGPLLSGAKKVSDPFRGPQIKPTAIILHFTEGHPKTGDELVGILRGRTDNRAKYPNGRAVQLGIMVDGSLWQLSETLETKPIQSMPGGPEDPWNQSSIGIEASGYEKDIMSSPEYQTYLGVVKELMTKYGIKNEKDAANHKGIFGHSEVMPGNSDPGNNFLAKIRADLGTADPGSGASSLPADQASCCSAGGSGVSELEGHKLPAAKGGTMTEVEARGHGAAIFGKIGAADMTGPDGGYYYINMRWRYVKALWNGHTSSPGPEDGGWYSAAPRKVLVTNPKTQKSVILVIADYGPAAWTGTPENNPGSVPPYWHDPQEEPLPDGSGYNGRVSGMTQEAIDSLGAVTWVHGEGDELLYAWAPDQNAQVGPTSASAAPTGSTNGAPASTGSGCGGGGAGGFVFPLKTTKADMTSRNGNQLKDGKMAQGGHPYAAYDIMEASDIPVVAALGGTVTHIGEDKCGGRLISIYNAENDVVISYLHMNTNTMVSDGQAIQAGQQIGIVGPPSAGCGDPHLHIDAAAGHDRPGCKRENCPPANAAIFQQGSDKIQLPEKLYETYNTLP